MIRMMCEDLSFVLVKNRIISEDDREVYIYGLELIVNSLLIVTTIMMLGILFNKVMITIVFLIVFSSIRSYTGGYHANEYWKCYLIACSTYLSIIAILHGASIQMMYIVGFSFLILSYIGIFKMAPLNSYKNPKTEQEMRKNNIISKILVSVYTCSAIVGLLVYPEGISFWFTIACTQLVVTIFLMITILQRRNLR